MIFRILFKDKIQVFKAIEFVLANMWKYKDEDISVSNIDSSNLDSIFSSGVVIKLDDLSFLVSCLLDFLNNDIYFSIDKEI